MDGPTAPSVDALGVLAGEIAAFAETIADVDVRIALEFNWGPLVRSLASAVAVCERVDRANVGVLFDPAHYHCTPTKAEHLDARTIPWIAHVHVDDMADIPGELSHCNDDRRLPGDGILDLPDLFGRIERGGYTGSFSIEMFSAEL